ncbi:CFEM domain protein [Metarhizium rileyi]|uniref:CFEM domain protein n=1 Tax=Metarhizium rileyi (strain RCEF 4871) TaxID=1649241 RepID=A0A167AXH8_METRR|nr:CFEM domain protein [Metarhizium rileyi RCEF 4871]
MKRTILQSVFVVANLIGFCKGQSDETTSYPVSASTPSSRPPATTSSAAASPNSTSFTGDLSAFLAGLPSCGAPCVTESLSSAQCRDMACLCSNRTISNQATQCVERSCYIRQQLETKNATETACNRPPRDRSGQYNATSIALCVVTGLLVIMRLIFKQLFSYHKALRSDDWVILASIVVGLPCTILNIVGLTHNGLGKDVWTLRPGQVVEFATYFFSQQILYLFLMTSIKISLLCFYLTLFPGRTTRILLWVSVGVVLAFGICSVFVSIFQCTPVRYYWMQYVQQEGGECLNINLLGWINGGVSVAIDVWMIGIPLFQIRKLELHWKKKIGATIMFLTGTFVTVVSILRLQSLLYFFSSDNPTWDLWHTAWWSTLEINVGLICACLPTIRLILVRVWPRVFGSTVNSTSARSKTSGRHSILPRKQQVRIPSTEIQLEDASSLTEATEERWEESAQRPREQYDYSRSHAR